MNRPDFQTTSSWPDKHLFSLLPVVLTLVLFLLLSPFRAQAYMMEGKQILALMLEKLGSVKGFNVVQKITLYADESQPIHALTEVLNFSPPDAFRSDISIPDGFENRRRTHVVSNRRRLILLDDRIDNIRETPFDVYKDLLLYRSREPLFHMLEARRVDMTVSSLGLFEGQPCYIVGAEYPDTGRTQVWLDKSTALPVRWMFPAESAGMTETAFEIRYLKWERHGPEAGLEAGSGAGAGWYPMHIVFYQGREPVREIRVEDVRAVTSFPVGLFDIEHISALYRSLPDETASPEPPAQTTGPGQTAEMLEVRQIIEEFRKIYE